MWWTSVVFFLKRAIKLFYIFVKKITKTMYTIFMNMKLHTLPFLLTVVFTSCSPSISGSESKNAIQEYEIVTKQEISLCECLSQEEPDYLVFFHSDTCGHCKEIMEDVIRFAESNIMKMYFLNVGKDENKVGRCSADEITTGIDQVDDLRIVGTPTIMEVEDGITTMNVAGKDDCLKFLNELTANLKDKITIA